MEEEAKLLSNYDEEEDAGEAKEVKFELDSDS